MSETQENFLPKTDLLARISQAYTEFEGLLASLDEAQMIQPQGPDGLSVKDQLAHLATWLTMAKGWLTGSLPVRFAPGYEIGTGDLIEVMHRLNADILAGNKDKPLTTVLAELRTAQQALVTLVESLSEEALNDPDRFAWWPGRPVWENIAANTYKHYAEHAEDIRAWLAISGSNKPKV